MLTTYRPVLGVESQLSETSEVGLSSAYLDGKIKHKGKYGWEKKNNSILDDWFI